MAYVVLARKYRPQTFSSLTGQEHVSRTLQNAIDTGRVAHAFLFTGARGVGKTSSARILAKVLNCEEGVTTEPCNNCSNCKEITEGNSTDVFEIDGASNTGVDDVRDLRDNIKYLPSHSRYKIFIIDEVHMLSNSAFNALLKTLEEPPAHIKFIFATTEPHKVPITILSRCQRFDFKRILLPKLIERLRFIAGEENIEISDAALAMIARKGDGSMRDALSTFDQVLAFCGSNVTDVDVATMIGVVDRRLLADISAALFNGDTQRVLLGIKEVDDVGYNMRQFSQELIEHFRNLLIIRSVQKPEEILELSEAELSELRKQTDQFSISDIQRRLSLLLKAEAEMGYANFPRLIVEIALLKAATIEPIIPIQQLLDEIRVIEANTVNTPTLQWNTTKKTSQQSNSTPVREKSTASRDTAQLTTVREEPKTEPVAVTPIAREITPINNQSDWDSFVNFCIKKRVAVGSIFEHGSPLKLGEQRIEIGFSPGHYLNMAQDSDIIAELKSLLKEFTGIETSITVKSINPADKGAPPSLAEKKESDGELLIENMKKEVAEHPLINEALKVFGGSITDIRKT